MELTSIEVQLPRRRVKVEPLNRRFIKLGFAKLESLKRDSLQVVDSPSPPRRYKTERSEERGSYFNEFCEWNNQQQQGSLSSLRTKKQIQPLCIYKRPRIRDNPFSFRRKLLPKMSDKKFHQSEEAGGETAELTNSHVGEINVSTVSFNEEQLVTFYPTKKLIH